MLPFLLCTKKTIITARRTKFGARYYFSTCLSFCVTGGKTWAGTPRGKYTPRQVHPPGHVHPPGRYTPWAGTPHWAGTPPWQIHPPCTYTPTPRAVYAGRYGQQAGGTHPTGMHSSFASLLSDITVHKNLLSTKPSIEVLSPNGILFGSNQKSIYF